MKLNVTRFELEERLKKSAIQTISGNDKASCKNIRRGMMDKNETE